MKTVSITEEHGPRWSVLVDDPPSGLEPGILVHQGDASWRLVGVQSPPADDLTATRLLITLEPLEGSEVGRPAILEELDL